MCISVKEFFDRFHITGIIQSFAFGTMDRGRDPKLKLFINMEQLNKVEIRGYVGNVTRYEGDKPMYRITVATSHAFKDRNGAAVIETTWHNVVAWEGRACSNLSKIDKGSKIQVSGRLRNQKYTGSDGIDRYSSDIYASRINLIEGVETFSYEI